MSMIRLAAATAVVLCLNTPAIAAMYTIKNPAEKISNPANKIHNPATEVNNPAANIYNPATRMNNPDPLSPPTPPVPPPAVTEVTKPAKQIKGLPTVPQKKYYFKTDREYITAAKKAFTQDDYVEFLSITEDALRRIGAGTLNASKKTKQKLTKYKEFGYGLLEKNED